MKKAIIPLILMLALILSGCNAAKENWIVKPTFAYEDIRQLFDYSTKAKVTNFTVEGIPKSYGDFAYKDYFYYTQGGKRGLINNLGEVMIDAEADIDWCLEGFVDKDHNTFDVDFNVIGPGGHGYDTCYYDITKGKPAIATEGPMTYADNIPAGMPLILPVIKVTNVSEEYGEINEFDELNTYVLFSDGKAITTTDLQDGTNFNDDGIAAIKKENKWGFVNTKGDMIVDFKYEDAFNFSEGLAAVKMDGKWGYINKDGSEKMKPTYYKTTSVANGKAWIQKDGKWGYMQIIK